MNSVRDRFTDEGPLVEILTPAVMMTATSGRFAGSTGTGLYDRTYRRDKEGRFSSGSGVRDSLTQAGTAEEIAAAAMQEARRITGRDTGATEIIFDMAGSDVQTAREHCEGVLQGLERFPKAKLVRVELGTLPPSDYAHAAGGVIRFNIKYSSSAGREKYLDGLREGAKGWDEGLRVYGINDLKMSSFHTRNSDSPTATALHEFGHVVDIATTRQRTSAAIVTFVVQSTKREQRSQTLPGAPVRDSGDLVLRAVSGYATKNHTELVAEAFTDVMTNGSEASPLSRGIFDILEIGYNS